MTEFDDAKIKAKNLIEGLEEISSEMSSLSNAEFKAELQAARKQWLWFHVLNDCNPGSKIDTNDSDIKGKIESLISSFRSVLEDGFGTF